jgi:glycolate oxidase
MYKKVDEKILEKLRGIVGENDLLTEEPDMEPYSHDETPGLKASPEVVVRPKDQKQVAEILSLADKEKIPLTPRGGGTGLSGGAIPVYGGIVLSLEKMNKIREIDKDNFMMVMESGVINGNLQKEAEKLGLFYPVNPASMDSCTIGGNVAESSGGPNAVRYGTTKNYISGLKVLLPNGESLRVGGKLVKNVTDSNLLHLFLGSEGTLGVITEVTLRLIPKPSLTVFLVIPFNNILKVPQVANKIFSKKITPTMVELMDRKTLKCCQEFLGKEIQHSDAEAQLLVRLDGENKKEISQIYETIGEISLEEEAIDVLVAEEPASQERIWEVRSSIHEALVAKAGLLADEDVVVPRSEISNLIKGCQKISEKLSLPLVLFGHLGDGNIHVNFVSQGVDKDQAEKALPLALKEVFQLAISLGGKISGEHGVGLLKKPYFASSVDPKYIDLMKGIKGIFDPHNIMNPGKIWED